MSYDEYGDGYLCDGVYASWWLWETEVYVWGPESIFWETEDNNQDKHDEVRDSAELKEMAKLLERQNLEYKRRIKILSLTVGTAEAFRQNLFNDVLRRGLQSMAIRYCDYENLPSDYAEVALQKFILADSIEQHLKMQSITLSEREFNELAGIVANLYKNKNNKNIYSRVGEIQHYVHLKAKKYLGNHGELKLNSEIMRKLLSLSRLHLNIVDLKKSNIDVIINELKVNHQTRGRKIDPFPNYLLKAGKRFIKNWKVRHLRSLLFFATRDERDFLQKLLKMDVSVSLDKFIELLPSEWPLYDDV